jgi:hypothetical protein
MVTHDEAVALATALPDVSEGATRGNRAWKVGAKTFAWDRPFSKADLARFGEEPVPSGPILGIRMDDLEDTAAVLAAGMPGVFTIPHFDGYAAVLVQLDAVGNDDLRELLVDGWLACAPVKLREEFVRDATVDGL